MNIVKRVEPSAEQKELIARLNRLATRQMEILGSISGQRRARAANDASRLEAFEQLKTPRQANALGVFGRRGSGKTTVLTEVVDALINEKAQHGWYVLKQPLDLSYAPREFPHGLTLVHWLHDRLSERDDQDKPRSSRLKTSFERAAQSYFRGSDGFNQLVRNLALSPEHYAVAATREIGARLSLHRDIQDWLDQEATFRGVHGFVIAIDDVDLPPANHHQSLIWSLLDELHQDRLIVVMAGDLQRLQMRLAEEDANVRRGSTKSTLDPDAAQDLIYKVLPQVSRGELQPWNVQDRLNFPPAPNNVGDQAKSTIGELLDGVRVPSVLRPHFPALLPLWARGLENVWREIGFRNDLLRSESRDNTTLELQTSYGKGWSDLLIFLLESRFEFDLARQLREVGQMENLAPNFIWTEDGSDEFALWERLRERIGFSRSGPDLNWNSDIPELIPQSQEQGLRLLPSHARIAEALVDLALAPEHKTLTPERVVSRIPWLRAHYQHCKATVLRDLNAMDRDLYDSPSQAAAALYWLELSADNKTADVGFWPLMALQLGERKRLTEGMADFEPTGMGALDASGSDKQAQKRFIDLTRGRVGALIPYQDCRRILRLADALALQPWHLLEAVPAGVDFVGLARLAAILTCNGYSTAAFGDLEQAPCLMAAMEKIREAPDDLSETSIAEHFKALLDEIDALDGSQDEFTRHGISLLVEAPWFRGLA